MANSRIYLTSEAGGTTVVSRDTTATSGSLVLPASGNIASVDTAVTDNAIARYDSTTGKLQNSAITIDDSGNIGSGTQSFNGFGGSGFKNYIINGNFSIWQYGVSQTTSGYGSDDRWVNYNNISTKTHSQVACTDTERALFNASKFSRTVSTYIVGTNSFVKKYQLIEDITKLAGKTVTVSFWARADSNKKMNIQAVDLYGSGGTPTQAGSAPTNLGNVDLTSTWNKYQLTTTLPSLIGKTLGTDGVHTSGFRLDFGFTFGPDRNEVILSGMPSGQSGTFDIAQVQLEEGSIATPFENRPYGLELSLCQRYLPSFTAFAGTGTVRSTTAAAITIPFKVATRVPPTGIIVSGSGNIENGGTWTQMVGTFSSASITSANTLWTNGAATMTIGQGSQLNLGTNTVLFTGCEL